MNETAIDRPLRDTGLWLGMIAPPSVWLIQFQTIYVLVYSACGAQHNFILHFTCAVFFAIIVAFGVYPLRSWSGARADTVVSRTRRFMAIIGVMSASLFGLVVIAQWIAAALVEACPQ